MIKTPMAMGIKGKTVVVRIAPHQTNAECAVLKGTSREAVQMACNTLGVSPQTEIWKGGTYWMTVIAKGRGTGRGMTMREALKASNGPIVNRRQLHLIDMTQEDPKRRYYVGRPCNVHDWEGDLDEVLWQPTEFTPGWPEDGWEVLPDDFRVGK